MCDLLDCSDAGLFFFFSLFRVGVASCFLNSITFFSLFRVGVASCFLNSITCVVAKVIALMVDWFGGWVFALLVR